MRNSHATAGRLIGRLNLCLAAALLALTAGCGLTDSSAGVPTEPIVVRIAVTADGRVVVDDQPSTVEDLSTRLGLLAGSGAQIYYYREAADQQPHPNAVSVVRLVVDSGLPVSLSTRPDFSDYVDAEGQSHPRPVKPSE